MESRVIIFSPIAILVIIINTLLVVGIIYLFVLLIKALRKYLNASQVRKEADTVRKSLGEALKEQRIRCQMTQEFVAERLGVSRQAVSKWENGTSEPSTSNLLSLAKLSDISAEELLRQVQSNHS